MNITEIISTYNFKLIEKKERERETNTTFEKSCEESAT